MADSGVTLLSDASLHRRITAAAVQHVREWFCVNRVVPMYEVLYRRVLNQVTAR
jgi:hypothetical protein